MILRVILRFQRGVQLIMQVWTHWPVSLDNSGPILSLFKAFSFKVQVQVHLLKPTPGPNCFLLLPPFFFLYSSLCRMLDPWWSIMDPQCQGRGVWRVLAASGIITGKFCNSGQTCIAPDYVLVERHVRDEVARSQLGLYRVEVCGCRKWTQNPIVVKKLQMFHVFWR